MSRRRPVVIPPGELAQTDQDLALLADLTGRARRHAPHCPIPATCPGPAAAALLEETDGATRDRVLLLAVAELAARGHGAPTEPELVDPRPGHPRGRRAA
jgi:hypothetical protein